MGFRVEDGDWIKTTGPHGNNLSTPQNWVVNGLDFLRSLPTKPRGMRLNWRKASLKFTTSLIIWETSLSKSRDSHASSVPQEAFSPILHFFLQFSKSIKMFQRKTCCATDYAIFLSKTKERTRDWIHSPSSKIWGLESFWKHPGNNIEKNEKYTTDGPEWSIRACQQESYPWNATIERPSIEHIFCQSTFQIFKIFSMGHGRSPSSTISLPGIVGTACQPRVGPPNNRSVILLLKSFKNNIFEISIYCVCTDGILGVAVLHHPAWIIDALSKFW